MPIITSDMAIAKRLGSIALMHAPGSTTPALEPMRRVHLKGKRVVIIARPFLANMHVKSVLVPAPEIDHIRPPPPPFVNPVRQTAVEFDRLPRRDGEVACGSFDRLGRGVGEAGCGGPALADVVPSGLVDVDCVMGLLEGVAAEVDLAGEYKREEGQEGGDGWDVHCWMDDGT